MGWLQELFSGQASPKTFQQDLELLVARWASRQDAQGMTDAQIAARLQAKAVELLRDPVVSPEGVAKGMRPSQGA